MPEIDEFSLTTVPIELRFNETHLSHGTAFTWRDRESHFLITNWHNVSGRDPNTNKHLSKTAAEPNMLHAFFNSKDKNLGDKHLIKMQIRNEYEVFWCLEIPQTNLLVSTLVDCTLKTLSMLRLEWFGRSFTSKK